jgi:hypothetical protein
MSYNETTKEKMFFSVSSVVNKWRQGWMDGLLKKHRNNADINEGRGGCRIWQHYGTKCEIIVG